MRRRKSTASHWRIKENLRSGPRPASGPHVDYNARLYDPTLGRFLSTDPLIGHPGSTQSINPYSYVENNPLDKTDPTGEALCSSLGTMCSTSTKDVQSVTVNSNGSVTATLNNGKTISSSAGTLGADGVAAFAAGAAAKFGPQTVNYGNLSKMVKGLDPKATSDHTKISPQRVKAANMSALSACSYSTSCTTMGDWQRQGIEYLDPSSGFQAALFKNGGRYALAFAGTNDLHDIEASLLQYAGKDSKQFDEAVNLTGKVLHNLPANASLMLTGHSLGGGLASVGSLKWGVQADTFNAEGLSSGTIKR